MVASILLLAGAAINQIHGRTVCYVVKPGVFAGGAVLSLASVTLVIISYLILISAERSNLSSHKGETAMGQPQFPQVIWLVLMVVQHIGDIFFNHIRCRVLASAETFNYLSTILNCRRSQTFWSMVATIYQKWHATWMKWSLHVKYRQKWAIKLCKKIPAQKSHKVKPSIGCFF